MRRIAVIVGSFLVALGIAAAVGLARWGQEVGAAGAALYPHRFLLRQLDQLRGAPPPAVVWLGDSTILHHPRRETYPEVLQQRLLGPLGLTSAVLAFAGLDGYAQYALANGVAEIHPDVVVLIANLRTMHLQSTTRGFSDLLQLVPVSEYPALLQLPYSIRGMSAPRLGLARLLAWQPVEEVFFLAEGVRTRFQHARFWDAAGPVTRRPEEVGRDPQFMFLQGVGRNFGAYARPVGTRAPMLRFMAAATRVLVSRGTRVLVILTPAPTEMLAGDPRWDPARVAAGVDGMRAVLEGAGATFLSLYDALPQALFEDASGHFAPGGVERMTALVAPDLAAALAPRWPGVTSGVATVVAQADAAAQAALAEAAATAPPPAAP